MRPPLVNVAVHQSSSSTTTTTTAGENRSSVLLHSGGALRTDGSINNTIDFHKSNDLSYLHYQSTQRKKASIKNSELNGLHLINKNKNNNHNNSTINNNTSDILATNSILNSISDTQLPYYNCNKKSTIVQSQSICNENPTAYDNDLSSELYNDCRQRRREFVSDGIVVKNSNVDQKQPYFSRSCSVYNDYIYTDIVDKEHFRDSKNIFSYNNDHDDYDDDDVEDVFTSSLINLQKSDINAKISDNQLWHYSCDNRGSYVVPIDNSYSHRQTSSASTSINTTTNKRLPSEQPHQQRFSIDDDNQEHLAIVGRRKRRNSNQRRSLQFEINEAQRQPENYFDQRALSCYVPLLYSTVDEEEDYYQQPPPPSPPTPPSVATQFELYKSATIKAIDEYYNLACSKRNQSSNGSHDSASLLEKSSGIVPTIQPQIHHSQKQAPPPSQAQPHQKRYRKSTVIRPPSLIINSSANGSVVSDQQYSSIITSNSNSSSSSNSTITTTTPLALGNSAVPTPPKYSRFEQLIKNLVGRKVSRDNSVSASVNATATPTTTTTTTSSSTIPSPVEFFSSAATKATDLFSSATAISSDRLGASTSSLNSIHHKIWNVVPLLRRENSCSSLNQSQSSASIHRQTSVNNHHSSIKKCETVLALSSSSSGNLVEPIKAQNRLRNSLSTTTCSRCSSLLSLAAGSGSRYSLNISHGKFVPIGGSSFGISGCNNGSTSAIIAEKDRISPTPSSAAGTFLCKLCLGEVTSEKSLRILQCNCLFCTDCMVAYVEFEILEGAYEISCPDAFCSAQGVLSIDEISRLTNESLIDKHNRYRLNREVELDKNRTWCPRAGCETVCLVDPVAASKSLSVQPTIVIMSPCSVQCPTCLNEFCSGCKKTWHPTMSCEENTRLLAANGQEENIGIPFDSDLIKCCPMCSVPIEKDEGCAQMMCKRCKHVFCWYCLASLDDDFLLRHYDKGPCKNKLGHSRASVVWHRAQVIGIFAGFGILLLVASPLLLLAAPCIVCCKCRICNGATKLEETETEFDETVALHR